MTPALGDSERFTQLYIISVHIAIQFLLYEVLANASFCVPCYYFQVAPQIWINTSKKSTPVVENVVFTLYVRIKFFLPTLRGVR